VCVISLVTVVQVPASTAYTLPAIVGAKNNVTKSEPVWNMSFVKPAHTSYSYDATKGPGPAGIDIYIDPSLFFDLIIVLQVKHKNFIFYEEFEIGPCFKIVYNINISTA